MKHTEVTKHKISQTLKVRGIRPKLLPSREQCIENLSGYIGGIPWNKNTKGLQVAWNKGIKYGAISGGKNPNWNGGKPQCIDCGKELPGYQAIRCMDCHHKFNRGDNHYAWKGGFGNPLRRMGEYKTWRLNIYKRDFFTCQMPSCCYKGKLIESHHIKKVKDYPGLIFDVNNGITLCRNCHNAIRNREEMFVKLFFEIVKVQTATAPKGLLVILEFRLP